MASLSFAPSVDPEKLNRFLEQAVVDMGAAMHAALVVIGDKLGLYKAMAGAGALTPGELAERTGTSERYVHEWLNANAASGYVTYDAETKRYTLPPEQAVALAVENSPAYLPGAFQIISACFKDEPRIADAFRTGAGVGWHEHDTGLYEGTERFFRPNYVANLLTSWIPSLDGMAQRLEAGALVADVGCGFGASTILMAKAFPNSRFFGFDYHAPSIEAARERARIEGVADRVVFKIAPAKSFPGVGYDFVTFFDCLHDMGDPVGAATHVRKSMRQDGIWMVVEPFAEDEVEKNLNPVGRMFYSASTMICTPASRAQEVGLALGAQAGEKRIREVVSEAGFTRFRRATQTPFNLVFDIRP